MPKQLVSIPTLVEAPFIIATIGGVTFGSYTVNKYDFGNTVTYPNFMKSMSIVKVNGTVNTYKINFSYQVRPGDDPNLLDKIFSRASKDRKITLQYGDWNAPNYIYKNEEAIITNVSSSLNMNNASIDYSITCTSEVKGLSSTKHDFPSRFAKPSDVIIELLRAKKYGLGTVFSGMTDINKVLQNNLIASNDKKVRLVAQKDIDVLSYINYLVSCMINNNTLNNNLTTSKYFLSVLSCAITSAVFFIHIVLAK